MRRGPESERIGGPGLSRRAVLRGGAALVGGLIIAIEAPVRRARAEERVGEPAPVGAALNAFVHVPPEARCG